jgi:hypothetical protein
MGGKLTLEAQVSSRSGDMAVLLPIVVLYIGAPTS